MRSRSGYAAQVTPQFDAEIHPKGRFQMETDYIMRLCPSSYILSRTSIYERKVLMAHFLTART
jgi:hypothetical protein